MGTVIEFIEASAFLTLAVLSLASYRAARLVVLDEVLGRWRVADEELPDGTLVEGHDATGLRKLADLALYDEDGIARSFVARWLGDMLRCVVCAGVWCTLAVMAAWFWGAEWVQWGVVVAAVAGGQAFVSTRLGA